MLLAIHTVNINFCNTFRQFLCMQNINLKWTKKISLHLFLNTHMYIYMKNCLRSSCELRCLICDMAMKSACYFRGSGVKHENIGGKFCLYRIYSTTLHRYFVYYSIKLILFGLLLLNCEMCQWYCCFSFPLL